MPILLYDMSLIKGETHRQPLVVAELGEFVSNQQNGVLQVVILQERIIVRDWK